MGKRVRDDPGVREELRVARQYQIPLSVFRGRAPAPGEALWLDDDRHAAIAYEAWLIADRAARCGRCGTRHDDWVDEHGRRRRLPVWVPEQVDCPGCQTLADAHPGQNDVGVKGGWRHVRLVPYVVPGEDD